ncbi:Peptidyl-prolyl cis-trans isomerase FKBP16-1, chloroplastic, partial [Glycine soja]
VLPFLLLPPPCAASVSASPRCMEDANLNYAESNRVSILTVDKFSRRMVLQFLGFNQVICYASPALAAPIMPDIKEPEVIRTVDQFSGESNPVILWMRTRQMIVGLKEVLTGMRVGGKRRALIPPSVGYVNENLQPMPEEFGPRRSLFPHAQEPLVFEVQLLKILSPPPPPAAFN